MPADGESVKKKYVRCDAEKFASIPVELRQLPQWVCWRADWKEERGKYSKVPISPQTSREAKSNDPSTWGTFDEAVATFTKNDKLNGVGFEFSAQDPFTFIDLDDARDADSGEIGDWAQTIIEKINSYTEVSPSGTGIRILIEADPVGPSKRRGKVEIYSFGQYATITGNVISSVRTVEKRQGELADLYHLVFGVEEEEAPKENTPEIDPKLVRVRAMSDDDLITRATAAANGAKFLKLWNGEDVEDHSQADASLCSILAYWTRADVERIDRLFRLSKLFRKKWDERRGGETYGARTISFACRGVTAMFDPDLDVVLQIIRNDESNAEIMVQLHGEKFVWCENWDTWLHWTGQIWEPDADLDFRAACGSVHHELLRRLRERPIADGREAQVAVKWAVRSGDSTKMDAIEKRCKTRIKRSEKDFDRNAYLLACKNGVVDLRTGELRGGVQADWITRSTGINFIPNARCPAWDKFMSEIMLGDSEMVKYMWRVLGYCLTGDVTERAFFFLHGSGRNGKTTFVETLQSMLGAEGNGYAQPARFSTFLKKHVSGGANDDVAHLAGARVVVASEADSTAPLDTSTVKQLTGNDLVRARFLYAGEFNFRPMFKLLLVTNHVPPIHESTYSLWDRLHYVGFEYRIPDEKVDRSLQLKLLSELEGILAKAIQWCLTWQREGLNPPDKVLKGRKRLEEQMDTCGEFLNECCEVGDANKFFVNHKQLYHTFVVWCREAGIMKPPSSKWLANEIRNKKYTERKINQTTLHWIGLRLTTKAVKDTGEL